MTNAHSDGKQTILYASKEKSNKRPTTSMSEFAFKRLEKSLKDISTNNRPRGTKDFIAANKAAAKTHNRTNQSKASTSKKRNPPHPPQNHPSLAKLSSACLLSPTSAHQHTPVHPDLT